MGTSEQVTAPDWRQIAAMLYAALGEVDDAMAGGLGLNVRPDLTPSLQPAIDAYEYATDAVAATCTSEGADRG